MQLQGRQGRPEATTVLLTVCPLSIDCHCCGLKLRSKVQVAFPLGNSKGTVLLFLHEWRVCDIWAAVALVGHPLHAAVVMMSNTN